MFVNIQTLKNMNKFFSFVGRNLAGILAIMWFVLGALEVIFTHRYYPAFLQFQLALAWAFIFSNERSERRLLEKLVNDLDGVVSRKNRG